MTPRASWTELASSARSLHGRLRRLIDALPADTTVRFATTLGQLADRVTQLVTAVEEATRPDLRNSVVRHDLRAHLTVVIGWCELWQRRGQPSEIARHAAAFAEIVTAARHALSLLDRLVDEATGVVSPPSESNPPSGALNFVVPPPRLATEPGRLLIIDDRQDKRELLKVQLEQLGHTVTEADSGKAAFALLSRELFDLILLDVVMPEMDGFAVLDRLKCEEAWRHVPVLMVTTLDRLDSELAGIARGAEDYLTPPFNEMLLRARVGACLEKKRLRDREIANLRQIDRLLHSIFPPEVVAELTHEGHIRPRRHEKVGVCFIDVVGFTSFCDRHADQPEHVVRQLEWYVEAFETVARRHGVQKIKTIGDAFMMVSGLLRPVENPVLQLVRCASELLEVIRQGPASWQVRIGIHVGPVVAGTLGESQYSFDLWGSTVNIAARMETLGHPGTVTLSDVAWGEIRSGAKGKPRDVAVRGIGAMTVWEFEGFLEEPGPGRSR